IARKEGIFDPFSNRTDSFPLSRYTVLKNLIKTEGLIMTNLDIAYQRLHNQLITQRKFEKPDDVVRWLSAVQAQDYGAAKWALGLRSQAVTDDDIEQAFADGTILRTHVMRPTWHFVSPTDIRWMLALTASRVKAALAFYDRKLELDDAVFARC